MGAGDAGSTRIDTDNVKQLSRKCGEMRGSAARLTFRSVKNSNMRRRSCRFMAARLLLLPAKSILALQTHYRQYERPSRIKFIEKALMIKVVWLRSMLTLLFLFFLLFK
jgi:hypothetical protein